MGKRNQKRRAAKAKVRAKNKTRSRPNEASWPGSDYHSAPNGYGLGGARGPSWADAADAIELTIRTAGHAVSVGDTQAASDCAYELTATGSPIEPRLLSRVATRAVRTAIGDIWQAGWQPVELAAVVGRRHTDRHLALTVALLEYEAREFAAGTVHPRWRSQLSDLGAYPWPAACAGDRTTIRRSPSLGTQANLQLAIEILGLLMTLPRIQMLLPRPGTFRAAGANEAPIDERALARVRALLAKAESSEFPEEAEALSAKAQQLMARYALTRIVVESRVDTAQPVSGRRLWLDAPYAGAKSLLVSAVAAANRCRAVWTEALGFTTVIGEGPDLDGVELLSTSLLVQANRAMLGHGQQRNRYGESRTRSFRQSFLVAYASRVGERLRTATDAAVEEAMDEVADNSRLLPVLHAQAERVTAACEEMVPNMYSRSVSVTNGAGWAAGRAAADVAQFDIARAIPNCEVPARTQVAS